MSFLRRRWPLVLIALAPLLALWPGLLGQTVGPFDQIRQMAPWNGPKPTQPWDVLQADGVLQFYAWRDLVFTGWGQWVSPTWNPYQLGGTPLLANSQSAAIYPLHALVGIAHLSTALGIFLLAWFHLAWAGMGVYALVRQLGGSRLGGAVGGLLFTLSPFMLAWAALPSVISTVAWIPWLLAGIAAQFKSQNPSGRALWQWAIPLSIAMAFFAGHLQFVAYGLMGAGLFGVTLLFGRKGADAPKKGGTAVRVVLLVAAGMVISSVALLPVLRYSEFSHRRNVPSQTGYNGYIDSALKPADLVSRLANPYGQGNPGESVADDAPFSTFWPVISRRAPYAESALTIGPIALILIGLLAVLRPEGRRFAPLLVVAGFALLLALGTPLNQLLYFFAPGWSSTGSPGRVICLFVLAMCAVAGLAVPDEIVEDRKRALIAVGIGALLSLLTLAPMVDAVPQGMAADAWATISASAARGAPKFLLALVIAAAGVFVALTRRKEGPAALIGATVLAGLVLHVPSLVRMGDPSFLHTKPLAVADDVRVAVINEPWAMWQAEPALYPPNTPSVARIHDLGGYDSLLHRDTVDLLRQVDGVDPATPANGNMMFIKPSAGLDALAAAGVTEAWSRIPLPQLGEPFSNESGVYRYRVAGPGRASTPAGPAKIEKETLDSVTVRASGPGALTLRDRNMPGWTATVDGQSVEIKPGIWREVELSSGDHTVVFKYQPPGLATGQILGFGGFFLALIVSLFSGRGLLKKSDPAKEGSDNPEPVSAE